MEKSCREYAPKASNRPFFLILVNNLKQSLHERKRIIKKALKS